MFTDEQIAALKAPLAREHVKTRQQAGRSLSYVEGWVAIAEANRIFGFDGWDREMVDLRIVSEQPTKLSSGRDGWRVAYIGKVRIFVHSGAQIVREGTGYGSGIDADQGQAHESAVKECETDAMKRALMTFGNPFGLALYDKDQAEVAPAAPARKAAAVASPEVEIARGIYKRLREALRSAAEPKIVDSILSINDVDFTYVKRFAPTGHAELLTIAAARKTELLASA